MFPFPNNNLLTLQEENLGNIKSHTAEHTDHGENIIQKEGKTSK